MATSVLYRTRGAAPATPAAGTSGSFVNAEGRVQEINSDGVLRTVSESNRSNWIVNGGFWFAQRQAPGSAVTYSSTAGRAMTADQWAVTNENASASYQRIDTQAAPESGLQGRYYGAFLKITATGKLEVSQCIEGVNTMAIRGRTVRFQVWMKGTASQTVRLGLVQLSSTGTIDTIPATYISAHGANGVDPTLGANLAYIAPKAGVTGDNCTVNGNAADCSVTTAWQRFGVVFDVPSNCKNIIVSLWTNAQLAATNGFFIGQASLTDGMELQDFSPDSYDSELSKVLRYYAKTFAIDTAPAQNAGVTTGCLRCILGKAAAVALAAQFQWRYPLNLRVAAVTLTTFNPGAANAQVRQISGTAADLTATATANSTEQSVDITATGAAGGTVGDQCGIHVTADASL